MSQRFVAYYRVSTAKQGQSGLGLEAQMQSVRTFVHTRSGSIGEELTEIESGKNNCRPQLTKALEACRLTNAILVIAKLDRLSRDAHFLLGLEKGGVEFIAVDMPNANRLTVRLMAVIAQEEREMISFRTKAALAAARERGVVLGGYRGGLIIDHRRGVVANQAKADRYAHRVRPYIEKRWLEQASLRTISLELSALGVATPRGGNWSSEAVRRLIKRFPHLDLGSVGKGA